MRRDTRSNESGESSCRLKFKCLTHIINLACVIGFVLHVATISSTYFSYSTSINVQQSINNYLPAPKLALCIRYAELTNNSTTNMTVKQVFDSTPAIQDTLIACGLRDNRTNRIDFKTPDQCYRSMDIIKFYTQQFICYSFSQREHIEYSVEMVAHSIEFAFNLYNIRLSQIFDPMNIVLPIVYYGDAPYISRTFSSYYFIEKRNIDLHRNFISFRIGFDLFTSHLLEPPYDTKCSRHLARHHCIDRCLTHRLKLFNLVPANQLHFNAINVPHVTDEHLASVPLGHEIVQHEVHCSNKCPSSDCQFNYTITHTVLFYEKEEHFDRFVKVDTPQTPITSLTAVAKLTSEQFFIYIISLMGVWLGVSLVSLNRVMHKAFHLLFIRKNKIADSQRTFTSIELNQSLRIHKMIEPREKQFPSPRPLRNQ